MNSPHTHGELIDLGNGARAFVDGIPDTCEHDYESGPTVIHTASGRIITWRTYPEWAGYTDSVRVDLVRFRTEQEGDPITCMTGECRKCGKEFYPEMW